MSQGVRKRIRMVNVMSFNPGGGGSSTIAGEGDVILPNPQNNESLSYDQTTLKWKNRPTPGAGGISFTTKVIAANDTPSSIKASADYPMSPGVIQISSTTLWGGIVSTDAGYGSIFLMQAKA